MQEHPGQARSVAFVSPTSTRMAGRSGVVVLGLAGLLLVNALPVAIGPVERTAPIVIAIFIAALVSSVAGFAFSAICGTLLAPFVDHPVQAVQIMLVCSAAGQAYMVWSFRRDIDWRALVPFLVGAIPGLPVGLFLLLNAEPRLYAKALGLLLVVYAVAMLLRRPAVLRLQHPALDGMAGFLGGITGGIAAFPGAPVTIWCGFKGWSKERQRGLFQPFILVLQLAALALLASGIVPSSHPVRLDPMGIVGLPAMGLGTVLGLTLFRRLSDRQFSRVLNVFLIVSGLALVL